MSEIEDFWNDEEGQTVLRGFRPKMGATRTTRSEEELITASGPLTEEHLEMMEQSIEAGEVRNVVPQMADIKTLRFNHHRLAQCLSMGMDQIKAAAFCGVTPEYVYQLKQTPAFAELLDYYGDQVKEEFADFVSVAQGLSLDFLDRLREMLDTDPSQFTPTHVMDAIKLLADRTGHAPVQKAMNLNVNVGMGDKLAAARQRANAAMVKLQSDG